MSLGERFKTAREERGLTLSDVAEQIRIRAVYLSAIEDEDWKAIGAPVYTRGFLRTYARFLGLDPELAVSEFNQKLPQTAAPPAGRETAAVRQRSLLPFIWIAGIIAAALVGFVVYLFVSPPRQARVASQAVPPPAARVRPSATPAATARLVRTLSIRLTAPVWMRVTMDGSVALEGTFPAGTTKTFHGKYALVRIGNAGGAQITVDGRSAGKLGSEGAVVEKSFAL